MSRLKLEYTLMDEKYPAVLIVDDDESMRDTLEAILRTNYGVFKAADGREALQLLRENEINVVLLDVLLPDMSGLDILKGIKEQYPDIDVIMISALKEISTAVQAMKLGAFHYITKSFEYDEVLTLLGKVVERQRTERELLYLRSEVEQLTAGEFIVGRSKKMQEVSSLAKKVAKLPATVLILGESGTGKQLLARFIHKESGETEKPFVTLDLASIPESLVESTLFGHEKGAFTGAYHQHIGKFELANGGTLFLDEIGSLRYELQGRLLRAIQEGEIERVGGGKTIRVNVRLIAATNIDLSQAVRKGEFREDLFFRLNVIPITLPPLRERIHDLPQLMEFFIERYNRRFKKNIRQISRSAMDVLSSYEWPGNIRELENLVERFVAILDGDTILREHIPVEYTLNSLSRKSDKKGLLEKAMETFERNFILGFLEKEKWNRRTAARILNIPLSTLKYKIKKLELTDYFPDKEK